ncbi:hypothetical protein ACTTAL_09570 [Rhodobacter capsulatus]
MVDIYVESLRRLGIFPKVTVVDDAQFQARKTDYDFDMTWMFVATSLAPATSNIFTGARRAPRARLAQSDGDARSRRRCDDRGAAGRADPEDYTAAVQALDRVLTAGRYVIPIWYAPVARVAHSRDLHFPARVPLYGDWPGVTPDAWWHEAKK